MKKQKILAFIPVYNEEKRIGDVLRRFPDKIVDEILVVDDGSRDNSLDIIKKFNVKLMSNKKRIGVGAGIKKAARYGIENNFDILVVLAGNGKDDPKEIPNLLNPIIKEAYDYVQGSRFLKGLGYRNIPFPRLLAIKLFTLGWRLVTGFSATDATNGFRAYKLKILKDINIFQKWLDTYELEYYLYYLTIKKGYRIKEVPVSKYYPSKKQYTKIRPIIDWWRIIRPLIYLKLKIKK